MLFLDLNIEKGDEHTMRPMPESLYKQSTIEFVYEQSTVMMYCNVSEYIKKKNGK